MGLEQLKQIIEAYTYNRTEGLDVRCVLMEEGIDGECDYYAHIFGIVDHEIFNYQMPLPDLMEDLSKQLLIVTKGLEVIPSFHLRDKRAIN